MNIPKRYVGLDYDNKSGKYKMEKPKEKPNDYPENIECSQLLEMASNKELPEICLLDVRE